MRRVCIINARVVDPSQNLDEHADMVVEHGRIAMIGRGARTGDARIVDARGLVLTPGFIDLRVFTGEPGSEHRETIASAGEAAAAGGVTSMLLMPDTDPVIDDVALLDFVQRKAAAEALVRVHVAAGLTRGLAGADMTEMRLLAQAGAKAFTDGRRTPQNALVMNRCMAYAGDFDGLVMASNREDTLASGVMNNGALATRLGLSGVPVEAEVIALERDLRLAARASVRYHAATLSCAASVEAVRRAKAEGVSVTASVPVTHLTLNENDVEGYRTFFKLSPPLRAEDDRRAMVEGVADGTIDAVCSAHDPQDEDTKRLPFAEAADGAVGLETLLPASLRLLHDGSLPLPRIVDALSCAPARILMCEGGTLATGSPADFVLFDPEEPWVLDADALVSRSKNTPFERARFTGRVRQTWVGGECVFEGAAT